MNRLTGQGPTESGSPVYHSCGHVAIGDQGSRRSHRKSKHWVKLFADVKGIPVISQATPALGAKEAWHHMMDTLENRTRRLVAPR